MGGIPDTCVRGPAALTKAFSEFGAVLSVTVRRKEGDKKNWAFVTFCDAPSMAAALVSDVAVTGDGGEEVVLSEGGESGQGAEEEGDWGAGGNVG